MATEYACSKILSVIGLNAVMVSDLVVFEKTSRKLYRDGKQVKNYKYLN